MPIVPLWVPEFWKRSILGPLPLPRFRFRQDVVILLVAIPPTYLEAVDIANHLRFRFQNPNAYLFSHIGTRAEMLFLAAKQFFRGISSLPILIGLFHNLHVYMGVTRPFASDRFVT